eukprot:4150709-Amphidinium_carterae.2
MTPSNPVPTHITNTCPRPFCSTYCEYCHAALSLSSAFGSACVKRFCRGSLLGLALSYWDGLAVPGISQVSQVFGRTVVCSSLELCDEISRQYGVCVQHKLNSL